MRSPFLILLLLSTIAHPCLAVREGTSNANIMIKRYERHEDFGSAALWHEAAADCLEIISMPMTQIMIEYHTGHGNEKLVASHRRELAELALRRRHHLKQARAYWAQSQTDAKTLEHERAKIAQFIATWVPHYPNKFYNFGVYPTFFAPQRDGFKRKGDYAAALNIEADAADMCADQYNDVTIAYFKGKAKQAQYEKVRDVHRQRATLLRTLAQQNPKAWPPFADKRTVEIPKVQTQLKPSKVIRIAKSDSRVQKFLAGHRGVHEYAWFQGFAWTVSFYNHGWGNLAIVIVDDKTGEVVDVLNRVGDLEAREWEEEEEKESLK